MEHSEFRTFVQLEGQMKAARQLGAIVAGGLASAIEGLSTVMRRTIDRIRCARALPVRAGAIDGILPTII